VYISFHDSEVAFAGGGYTLLGGQAECCLLALPQQQQQQQQATTIGVPVGVAVISICLEP
jgi:hypothetical protein